MEEKFPSKSKKKQEPVTLSPKETPKEIPKETPKETPKEAPKPEANDNNGQQIPNGETTNGGNGLADKLKGLFDSFTRKEEPLGTNLLHQAKTAEYEINGDVQEFINKLTEYGCNSIALFHLTLRMLEVVVKEWEGSSTSLKRYLEEDKDRILSKAEEDDPEVSKEQHRQLLETLSKELQDDIDDLSASINAKPTDVSGIQSLKEMSRRLLDKAVQLLAAANVVKEDFKVGLTLQENVTDDIERLRAIIMKPVYTLVNLGLEKGGKSTWTNYLIGVDLVPTSEQRCTMVTTIIKNKETPSPGTEVEIHFYNKDEFETNLLELKEQEERKVKEARTKGEKVDDAQSLPNLEKQIRQAYESLTSPIVRLTGDRNNVRQQLRKYIVDSTLVYSVKKVVIFVDEYSTKFAFEIVDVPGYDSTIDSHRQMTQEAVKNADAFIYTHAGNKPDLVKSAEDLLTTIGKKGGMNIFQKGFSIVSHLDQSATLRSGLENFEKSKRQFVKHGIPEKHIFPACVAYDLLLEKKGKEQLSSEEVKAMEKLQKNYEIFPFLKNGTKVAKEAIMEYIQRTLPYVRAIETRDISEVIRKHARKIFEATKKIATFTPTDEKALVVKKLNQILDKRFKVALESANEWKWHTIREELFKDIIQQFKKDVLEVMESNKFKSEDLESKIPKKTGVMTLPDVQQVEDDERMRLHGILTGKVHEAINLIAREIYSRLGEFVDILLTGAGFESQEDIQDIFSLERIISHENCRAQIESMVMRCAYPAFAAYLVFRRTHPNREPARKVFFQACPEVPRETEEAPELY